MAAALPVAKLFGVFARQISKPISSRLQIYAQRHPVLRQQCIGIGQWLHWASVKTLRRSAGRETDRTIAFEVPYYVDPPAGSENATVAAAAAAGSDAAGGATAASVSSGASPAGASVASSSTVETDSLEDAATELPRTPEPAGWLPAGRRVTLLGAAAPAGGPPAGLAGPCEAVEWKEAGHAQRGWVRATSEDGQPSLLVVGVQPLSEDAALSRGSVFVGESFVFGVAAGFVYFEWARAAKNDAEKKRQKEQRRLDKEAEREADYRRRDAAIRELQAALEGLRELRETVARLEADVQELRAAKPPQGRR